MPIARPGFLFASAVLLVTAKGALGQDIADLPPDVQQQLAELWQPWKFTGEAQVAAGYDDNIYLSAVNPLGGAFVRGGLDARLMRLPTPTDAFSGFAFLTGDSTHFASGGGGSTLRPDEAEWNLGAQAQWQPLDRIRISAEGEGYYLDQVFDLSAITANRTVADMRDLSALGFLRARWQFWRGFWLEGEVQQQHDHFRERDPFTDLPGAAASSSPTESFDQRGGAGRLGWSRPGRAEVSLTYAERRRDYFERLQYTQSGGRPIPNMALSFLQREGTAKGEIDWQMGGAWSATTTLGLLANRDNGPGYFDFDEKSAREELVWERAGWRIALEGTAARYVFPFQQPSFGISFTRRIIEDYDHRARIERKLGEHWKVFAEEHWERNRSNDTTAGYEANTALAGAAFTY